MKVIDETGNRHGKLVVVKRAKISKAGQARWICCCDCGTEKIVSGISLRSGKTLSCGCLAKEQLIARNRLSVGENNPNYGKRLPSENNWMRGRIGDKHPGWKGGRHLSSRGYVRISNRNHPKSDKSGRILEHHLVMEKMIGRHLKSGEVVHHCDGDKQNNGPYNLRLFRNNAEHTRFHKWMRINLSEAV